MEVFTFFNYIYEFFDLVFVSFVFIVFSLFFRADNFVKVLVYLELMFLLVNMNFVFFSFVLDDIVGQIFSLFILAVVASESAIFLAILVIYYKLFRTILIYSSLFIKLTDAFYLSIRFSIIWGYAF